MVAEEIDAVGDANARLLEENRTLAEVKAFCTSLGITNLTDYYGGRSALEKVRQALDLLPPRFGEVIAEAADALDRVRRHVAEIEKAGAEPMPTTGGRT